MEAHEQATSDVDLGGEAADDPFKDVPPDPLADGDLPPGVIQGSLPGDNPSEMEPEAEAGDPEPEPGEFMEEPEERDDLIPDEEEAPAAEVPDDKPDALAEPEAEPETHPQPEPETPVAGSGSGEKSADPPKPEKPKAAKRQSKAKKGKGKKQSSQTREYVILRKGVEPGEWREAFERPDPDSDEPFVLESRNGTTALRAAYRLLSEAESEPQEYLLICVPRNMWQIKKVAGRVHRQTAISVG